MADLTFGQQVAASSLAVLLGGAVSIFAGWGVLRRQERIKREEELAATLRKVQADALVTVASALGRYHWMKARTGVYTPGADSKPHEAVERFRKEENDALERAMETLADVHFLLGGDLGRHIRQALLDLIKADSEGAQHAAVRQLESALEGWISPLPPVRSDRAVPRGTNGMR